MYVMFGEILKHLNLLQQLKTGFKRTINWNKYQLEPTIQTRNRYLNHLIDPSFQEVNRLFALAFENNAPRKSYKRFCFLLQKEKIIVLRFMEKTFLISQ